MTEQNPSYCAKDFCFLAILNDVRLADIEPCEKKIKEDIFYLCY
ncbi:hypothetical protein [Vibrio vulnificus YJ016]|uniref:Uncharacterized protein n=1 Tax=Vibrio vulnificus (strain YJ016) TaxID=196600 RepID=Q7MFQ6_VIBVY|nr:hypothetical protein [Vibrio vulnificus YJ016]